MSTLRVIAIGAALMLGAAVGVHAQPAGDAKAGEAAYMKLGCYSCHGVWGQGTWRDGPRINPPMPYEAMLQQLRTPRYEMPPYVASVMPDKSIADIIAYLKSVPSPVDTKTIKALQKVRAPRRIPPPEPPRASRPGARCAPSVHLPARGARGVAVRSPIKSGTGSPHVGGGGPENCARQSCAIVARYNGGS